MKNPNIARLAVFIAVLGLTSVGAMGQLLQTQNFSITNNSNFNDSFADYTGSLASLQGVEITLTVTSLSVTGTFQGTNQNPTIPSATFTDTISLQDTNYPPASLTETDTVTGSGPVAQNQPLNFGPNDNFVPLPNSSSSTITAYLPNANLANYVGHGTFNLDVMTQMINPPTNLIGATVPNYGYTVKGTVTVQFLTVPEPSPSWLGLLAGMALAGSLGARRFRTGV